MVVQVVEVVEAELDVFATSVADPLAARIQASHGTRSAALRDALCSGVHATVRDALARLRFGTELPGELPPGLIELARLCAASRCEAAELADAWLVGQELFWERFEVMAERTIEDTTLRWGVMRAARARLRGYAACVSALFRGACGRASSLSRDSRLPAVLRALDGLWVDSSELRYDLAYHHIAIVAEDARSLDGLARRTGRQLLSVEASDGGVWAWLGGATALPDADLDALIAWYGSRPGQLAFGEPAAGIAGFAASHHQALEARIIAAASDLRAVRFADLRLLVALLRHADLATGLIERELGELNKPDERKRELRATLRAYLENSQNISATAARRGLDRKTIKGQLRSAEGLIQHRVCDRSGELLVALRVADIMRHYGRDSGRTIQDRLLRSHPNPFCRRDARDGHESSGVERRGLEFPHFRGHHV